MTLREELKNAVRHCVLTNGKHIRSDIVRNIITVEGVKRELPPTWGRRLIPYWDWGLEGKVQRARKVIAILILLGKYDSINALLADGLEDDDLPLVKYENYLRSQCGNKSFKSFITCPGHRDLVDMFLETQWIVWAPVLDFKDGNLIPIHLPPSSRLPFDYEVVDTTIYSAVYKGALWPSCYRGIKDKPNRALYIAIKQFKDGPKDDKDQYYRQEMVNLGRVRMIENEHLSKPLASCEEARCIFFPWADNGDLWDFWKGNGPRELGRTSDVFLWALRQITGLTHALELIHQTGTRHGDLKPSNILHFTDGNTKLGTLKIADFGVSRTHEVDTGFRTKPTITKASTFTYEAPEAHEPYKSLLSRSRKYDCWSMGCIMLEFVIWLLHDFTAITSFKNQRKPPEFAYYRPIIGSDLKTTAMEDEMEVHPMVDEAVRGLENHPWFRNTAVESITKLARSRLLKIKPEKRLGAGDAHEALKVILATAEEDMSCLTKEVDEGHPIPSIFSQPSQKVISQATYEQR